jgi:hypothetical protein
MLIDNNTPPLFSEWLKYWHEPWIERAILWNIERRCQLICAMDIDQPKSYPLSIACQLAHAQDVEGLLALVAPLCTNADPLLQTFVAPRLKSWCFMNTLVAKQNQPTDYDLALALAMEHPDRFCGASLEPFSPLQRLKLWALSGDVQGLLNNVNVLNHIPASDATPCLRLLLGKYLGTKPALHEVGKSFYYCVDPLAVEKHLRTAQPRTLAQSLALTKTYAGEYSRILQDFCRGRVQA